MILFTDEIVAQLIANGRAQRAAQEKGEEIDFRPVVRLFHPAGSAWWMFTEADPDNPDLVFGLCFIHEAEFGFESRADLQAFRPTWGLGLERDICFRADRTLSEYWREAREARARVAGGGA